MNRRWLEIASYACNLLGGLICLPGLICVFCIVEEPGTVFKLARDLFPEASWPSIFGGLALLPIGAVVFIAIGARIRDAADQIAPEFGKSVLGLCDRRPTVSPPKT